MSFILSVILVVAAVVLTVVYLKLRQRDHLDVVLKKRQATSKLINRADYMEGMERIPVVVALSGDTFFYENPDLEASFELARIDEIEYDDELATGKHIEGDNRVMRLRSHNTAFEFVMPKADAAKWAASLPARRIGDTSAAQAV